MVLGQQELLSEKWCNINCEKLSARYSVLGENLGGKVSEGDQFLMSDQLASVVLGVITGIAAYKLIDYVAKNLYVPQNRYQVGVGSKTSATEIAPVLEKLTDKGLLVATGDKSKPNERTYRVLPNLKVSA